MRRRDVTYGWKACAPHSVDWRQWLDVSLNNISILKLKAPKHMPMDFLRRPLPYRAEYTARSSTCKECMDSIERKSLRMAFMKKDVANTNQPTGWYHIDCFFDAFRQNSKDVDSNIEKKTIVFGVEHIEHFGHLRYGDQTVIRNHLNGLSNESVNCPPNVNVEKEFTEVDAPKQRSLREQSDVLYTYFDQLDQMTFKEINILLEHNGIRQAGKKLSRVYSLADAMAFGVPEKCPKCVDNSALDVGQLVFRVCGYICSMGALTSHVICDYYTDSPKRSLFKIPEELKSKHKFLSEYRPEKKDRKYIEDFVIALSKYNTQTVDDSPTLELIEQIRLYAEEHKKGEPKIDYEHQSDGNDRIDEAFSEPVGEGGGDVSHELEILRNSDNKRYQQELKARNYLQLFLKGGYAVDPDSGLGHCTHIYCDDNHISYDSVLTYVRLYYDKNQFYKIQLLEEDNESDVRKYYIFRKWGRIGENYSFITSNAFSLKKAVQKFKNVFYEKTGSSWQCRPFTQKPFKYFPLNIENFNENSVLQSIELKDTKHCTAVKDLIYMIFDVKKLKQQMFEFNIDLNRMPLGMVSESQLLKAKQDLFELIAAESEIKKLHFSTKFYQDIPHKALEPLPQIKTEEQLISKLNMLYNLSSIQIAYQLLCPQDINRPIADPIDYLIGKLNTNIGLLDRNGLEFETIEKYVANGPKIRDHPFCLQISNVFEIKNHHSFNDEMKNKKKLLLWHGSLTTNFASILLSGFQLSPEGVKTSSRLFGNGFYFADLVTKSGGYCFPNRNEPPFGEKILLLLCEVVVDNMKVCISNDQMDYIQDSDDCVKWVGHNGPLTRDGNVYFNVPLPNTDRKTDVPLGQFVNQSTYTTAGPNPLRYNEYLVRKTENIGFKYLVECYVCEPLESNPV